MAPLSLAEQIAQLDATAPTEFEVEEDAPGIERGIPQEEDVAASREHYVTVGPSSLRRAQNSISDLKYAGTKTSRKQLMEESDPEDDESLNDEEDDDGWEDEADEPRTNGFNQSEEKSEPDIEPEDTNQQPSESNETIQTAPAAENMTDALRKFRDSDKQKGKAVTRQMAIWDTLLDARIRLQKSVVSANRLPPPSEIPQSDEYEASLLKMLEETALLSEELFELQEKLLQVNDFITPPPRKRQKTILETTRQEFDAYLCEASRSSAALDHTYHPHLLQTLSKWSSKIQAVAPAVLLPSSRSTFSKNTQNLKSAVQLVDEAVADHGKTLSRTQIWRSKSSRLGKRALNDGEEEDVHDPEIFDDTDFYQQLLRDVIDTQGGRDDWQANQKQRKAKKKVDTKASKGRKIRYEVHEKLQNFMVPVPVHGSWHAEQIDELFASLLGKGFENALGPESMAVDQGSIAGGFRVF